MSTCLLSLGLFVCNFLEKFTLRESCQTRKLFRPSLLIHSPSSVFPTIPPNKTDPWCWEEGYGFCSELVEWLSSICAFLVPITNAHFDYRWEAEHWVESSWHYLAHFMQWKTTAARGQGGLKVSKCSLFVFCLFFVTTIWAKIRKSRSPPRFALRSAYCHWNKVR